MMLYVMIGFVIDLVIQCGSKVAVIYKNLFATLEPSLMACCFFPQTMCDGNVMVMLMFGLLCDVCEVKCDAKHWVQQKTENSL